MTNKENFKIIFRWLARHYDRDVEQAVFDIERVVDGYSSSISTSIVLPKEDEAVRYLAASNYPHDVVT